MLKNDLHNCKYARSDIIEKIIKKCGGVEKCNDGVDRLNKENQKKTLDNFWILKKIKLKKRQKITEEYKVAKYFIDLFSPVHKLGIKIDETGHLERCKIKGKKEKK